jgi:hypothetical protein
MAVLLAFSSCLVGGLIATAVASLLNGAINSSPMAALYELLIGMMFRMGVPMGAALVVLGRAPALRDAGFVFYLLPFFAVSLAIQTAIAAGSHQLSVDEATASKSGSTNST